VLKSKHAVTSQRIEADKMNVDEEASLPRELKEWSSVLHACHAHLDQHWGVTTQLTSSLGMRGVTDAWQKRFEELNQDVTRGSSLTDLLYVTRCYGLVVDNIRNMPSNGRMDLAKLYECYCEVRLLAVQHTKVLRSTPLVAKDLDALELRAASFIVLELSRGQLALSMELNALTSMSSNSTISSFSSSSSSSSSASSSSATSSSGPSISASSTSSARVFGRGPEKSKALSWDTLPTPLIARNRLARCLDFQPPAETAVKEGIAVAPADAENLQPGTLWEHSQKAVLANFVPLASRVFHAIHRDLRVMSLCSLRELREAERDAIGEDQRGKLYTFLLSKCALQNPNSFFIAFRALVFECSMPLNAWKTQYSRKSKRASKLTSAESIIEDECGFHAISRLYSMLQGSGPVDESLLMVGRDRSHELHGYLLLAMVAFVFKQLCNGDFLKFVYFTNQRIDHTELHEFVTTKLKWGMHMRPVIVELHRQIYVLDVSSGEPFTEAEAVDKRVERIHCRDMYDALLYWMFLMRTKYNNELLDSSKIHHFQSAVLQHSSDS